MKYRYIGSKSGRYKTVHDLHHVKSKCQIEKFNPSKIVQFETLEEAITKRFVPCRSCINIKNNQSS